MRVVGQSQTSIKDLDVFRAESPKNAAASPARVRLPTAAPCELALDQGEIEAGADPLLNGLLMTVTASGARTCIRGLPPSADNSAYPQNCDPAQTGPYQSAVP